MEDNFFENPDSQSKTPSLSHLGEMVFAILEQFATLLKFCAATIRRWQNQFIGEKNSRPEPTKTKQVL
jgi:hypothetical protein